MQENRDKYNRILSKTNEETRKLADSFFLQELSWRQEFIIGGARERLASMGAFAPLLLVNVIFFLIEPAVRPSRSLRIWASQHFSQAVAVCFILKST